MFKLGWFKKENKPITPINPQKRQDFYLQHTPSQPKREIGDYVEKNGIRVPERFDSFRDAVKSKKKILVRSEHWREYAGESGILESARLGDFERPLFNDQGLREAMFEKMAGGFAQFCRYAQYCDYLGIPIEKFKSEASFSLWEMLDGYNLAIVADSAIGGKYHIFRKRHEVCEGEYASIENGKITFRTEHMASELQKSIMKIPAFYEEVRNLPNFDPTNCPVIEAQIRKGKIYFLQYHRGRDFEPPDFVLGDPKGNQKEALFVRGATQKEGLACIATMDYGDKKILPEKYGAYLGAPNYNTVYVEMLMGRVGIWFKVVHDVSLGGEIGHMATHRGISQLFKPGISIILGDEAMKIEEYLRLMGETYRTKVNPQIPVHIISDGRKAFIEWL